MTKDDMNKVINLMKEHGLYNPLFPMVAGLRPQMYLQFVIVPHVSKGIMEDDIPWIMRNFISKTLAGIFSCDFLVVDDLPIHSFSGRFYDKYEKEIIDTLQRIKITILSC